MYQFISKKFIAAPIEDVWRFFATPNNLAKITPPEMGFIIKTEVPAEMYPGLFIIYTLTPIFGIRMEWVTEITHIEKNRYFVDEQRKGPYRIWHHEHRFEEKDGGVECTDTVSYELPLGLLGKAAHPLFVRSKIEHIFSFREKQINTYFAQSQ